MRARSITGAAFIVAALAQVAADAGSVRARLDARDGRESVAQSNLHLFEDLVAFRDSHPLRFDQNHVFYFHLLTNTDFMDYVLALRQEDPPRFDFWNPFLWRTLDGYTIWDAEQSRLIAVPPPPPGPPISPQGGPTPDGGGSGGNGGGLNPQSVPEPSSALLLLTGSGALLCPLRCPRSRKDAHFLPRPNPVPRNISDLT